MPLCWSIYGLVGHTEYTDRVIINQTVSAQTNVSTWSSKKHNITAPIPTMVYTTLYTHTHTENMHAALSAFILTIPAIPTHHTHTYTHTHTHTNTHEHEHKRACTDTHTHTGPWPKIGTA